MIDRSRAVPAPGLLEVAQVWWDVERVPLVAWDRDGLRYDLVDPVVAENRLALLRLADPPPDPSALAQVLAQGLASCDFPPTGDGASRSKVIATLRAAARTETPFEA